MNSLSYSEPNLVNPEPIEWPLNSVFTNKYGKIRCWPRNYKYLWEFTNSFIPVFHWYATYSFIFSLLRISIGLSVFGFIANKYKRIAIQLLSTIRNIQSAIQWAIMKVILNYSLLPTSNPFMHSCLERAGKLMHVQLKQTPPEKKDKNKPFVQTHKFPSYLLPFDCQSQSHFRSIINWAAKTKQSSLFFWSICDEWYQWKNAF
jgi:ABC-type sugar transport system permease subunit